VAGRKQPIGVPFKAEPTRKEPIRSLDTHVVFALGWLARDAVYVANS
jgi:hypothetical protein